jgi:hypothetical protein
MFEIAPYYEHIVKEKCRKGPIFLVGEASVIIRLEIFRWLRWVCKMQDWFLNAGTPFPMPPSIVRALFH